MRDKKAGFWSAAAILLLTSAALADPPASATYEYDDAGRLKTGTFSNGKVVQYQYDPAGNRTAVNLGVPAQVSIAPASATEGQNVVFQITKTGASVGSISVDCVQSNGAAQAGGAAPFDDYTSSTQTITFPQTDPSGTQRPCTVPAKADSYYEGSQTFSAILQNPVGSAVITTGSALGTINDPATQAAPSFSVSGDTETEGQTLSYTITKSGLTELSHAVSYATADGTATTADGDYTAYNNSYSFAWNTATHPVSVSSTTDSKYESNETIAVNLSNATNGATIATSSVTGTINNDDTAPSYSINDPVSVNEGQAVVFTISRSGNTTQLTHQFSWATANNTAVAPGDYTALASQTVTFQPSDTQKTISVQSNTDAVASEGYETFYVNLSTNGNSNGATLADSQGVGTIADATSAVPSVPANIWTDPAPISSGNWQVIWNASTGPVSYYVLEESSDLGTVNHNVSHPSTFKDFFHSALYRRFYFRVKACNSGAQCSAFSYQTFIDVCSAECP